MSATESFSSMTGRTGTWPTPATATPGVSNLASLKLDVHRSYLGLYR
jgi:hypothetical protein